MEGNMDPISLGVLGAGVLILLSGVLGIKGGISKRKCMVSCFAISTIFIFLVILTLAIIAVVGRDTLKDEIGTVEACMDYLESEELSIKSVDEYWCNKSVGCPCYMEKSTLEKYNIKGDHE